VTASPRPVGVPALTAAALPRYIPPLMLSVKRLAHLLVFSPQRAKWLSVRNRTALGLVLIGLAAWAMVYLLPSAEPVPGNTPAAASPPAPSPGVVRPTILIPPASATLPQSDNPVPSPAASKPRSVEGSAERKTAKSRASHKWRMVERLHASFFRGRAAVLPEPCRDHCDDWAEPMTWHGGGY
jgi:hypothetical protein